MAIEAGVNVSVTLESYGQMVAEAVRLEFPDLKFTIECGNENTVKVSGGTYAENIDAQRAIDDIMDRIWLSLDYEVYTEGE